MKTRFHHLIATGACVAVLGVAAHAVTTARSSAQDTRRSEDRAAAVRHANELSDAFVAAAEAVQPSVVSIRAIKVVQPALELGELPLPPQLLRRFQLPFEGRGDGARGYEQRGMGSGLIVDPDGLILTNNHVVDGATELEVALQDGRRLPATVVGTDALTDLAVVRVDAEGLAAARLGDSDGLSVGSWVIAVGNPFGLENTITAGIVSAKARSNVHVAEFEDFIQTDAAINPGNSGGPLVDLHGDVVGINTAIASRSGGYQGIGFAIPSNLVKSVMDSLVRDGKVTRGMLGVIIQPLDPDLARSFDYDSTDGALVAEVTDGSAADRAGMKPGDIVTAIDGRPVRTVNELRNAVAATAPGTAVDLDLFRDGRRTELSVRLDERSDAQVAAGRADAPEPLGLDLQPVTPDLAAAHGLPEDHGLMIRAVEPGSAASRAGLEPGDVILDVQGKAVSTLRDFHEATAKADLKSGVRLTIRTGDHRRFLVLRES